MATMNASLADRVNEQDLSFTEFLMRTWTGSENAGGHAGDLGGTAFAGFGVLLGGEETAEPRTGIVERALLEDLVIEDLDHPAPVVAAWTYCG
ncbi:hypothetical protein [Streptosporangium sp. NPDC049046]|uniref:hypothetical protein n=1 Tax=Streptosporangium sp. NPDC049046 TaxID=3155031 RepID=UPI00342F473D